MDLLTVIVVALVAIGTCSLLLSGWRRRGAAPTSGERIRRGTGHALLGLQQFIEPTVEHVFEVENREHIADDEHEGDEDDPEAIQADLAASLARSQIDTEEVRRHLAAAARAGLDWHAVYDQAVRDELGARPFKAPTIPPAQRVAPRE
ncbi:MAG: hypothetical protein P4L84_32690 [Isosphaeraceae bacterium]|nr:hypothetical protein [Isosphaeraceae bacterium]